MAVLCDGAGSVPSPGRVAAWEDATLQGREKEKANTEVRHRPGIHHIVKELIDRKPHYISDWTDGLSMKVLSAFSYMFFASLAPAITLGAFLLKEVKGQYGPIEVLVSTAICGIIFSVFAGQGMVIVGVTGPVCIFSVAVYKAADSLDLPFLPWMAWIAIWACGMHLALALSGSCHFVTWVTRYACETFGSLIGIIYVWTAFMDVITFFREETRESAFCCLVICLGTYYIGENLSKARDWNILTSAVREALASYAVPISMISFTIISIVIRDNLGVDIPRIQVPESFEPTTDRSWLVDIADCPGEGIVMAIVPAFVLTVLFFFDHNVSSLMAQAPEFKLQKPPAYNWDFLIVGLLILICGLLGIPFTNGLIPQAPLHVHALSMLKEEESPSGLMTLVIEGVKEQRLSNFSHALVIGLCCSPPVLQVLRSIPLAALAGLFLYMGMGSFAGNGFVERLLLPMTDPKRRSQAAYAKLESLLATGTGAREIAGFTLLQFALWAAIFGITFTPAAIAFPVLIASLVVVRWALLPRLFSTEALTAMDGEDNEPDVVQIQVLSVEGGQKTDVDADAGGRAGSKCSSVHEWAQGRQASKGISERSGSKPRYAFANETIAVRADNEALLRLEKRLNSKEATWARGVSGGSQRSRP